MYHQWGQPQQQWGQTAPPPPPPQGASTGAAPTSNAPPAGQQMGYWQQWQGNETGGSLSGCYRESYSYVSLCILGFLLIISEILFWSDPNSGYGWNASGGYGGYGGAQQQGPYAGMFFLMAGKLLLFPWL